MAKKFQPKKDTSKKSENLLIKEWMTGNKKQNDQDVIVYPQTLEAEDSQPEGSIVNKKNPRIETGLLKIRIAEKVKKLDSAN